MKVLPVLLLLRHELFVECAEVARLTASIGCFEMRVFDCTYGPPPLLPCIKSRKTEYRP